MSIGTQSTVFSRARKRLDDRREIARRLARGETLPEIAAKMHLSRNRIETLSPTRREIEHLRATLEVRNVKTLPAMGIVRERHFVQQNCPRCGTLCILPCPQCDPGQ